MLQVSDIIAFYGTDFVSQIIRWATWGPSHVGIVVDYAASDVLFESTSLAAGPCLMKGKPFAGCQLHEPAERVRSYLSRGGRAEIWRLVWSERLNANQKFELSQTAMEFVKRGVSYSMSGAILSGTNVLTRTDFLPTDVHHVFCSQVIHSLLKTINLANHDNSAKYNPARLLRELHRTGTYFKYLELTPDNIDEFTGDLLVAAEREPWGDVGV